MRLIAYPTRRQPMRHTNFNNFFSAFAQTPTNTAVRHTVAVNIVEEEDKFLIMTAAPGHEKGDFSIELDKNVLTISATASAKDGKYLRREFSVQEWKRSFDLPQTIDTSAITAAYVNGILTLTLSKKEAAKPQPARKVEIA